MSRPIRAILLDIDDTVLDTTTAMLAAGRAAMSAVWPEQSDDWHVESAARFRTDPAGFFPRYARGELSFDEMRERRLVAVAESGGVTLPPKAFATYERAYRPAFEQAQHVFPDVRPFLDRCADLDLAVGAVTNASAELTAGKLAATGTSDWYATVVTRDTLGFGKPDPRVFHHACAELGVEPGETAYVGDEVEADVHGPHRAGLAPVWIRRESPGEAPGRAHQAGSPQDLPPGTLVVRDLTSLPDALDLGLPGGGR